MPPTRMQLSTKLLFTISGILSLALLSVAVIFINQHMQQIDNNDVGGGDQQKFLNLIVDTDIGPWPDDVGVMAMLNTWQDEGRLKILAIMGNNLYSDGIVPVIDVLDTYFNRTDIEIGVTKDPRAANFTSPITWTSYVLKHYPHPHYQSNAQAPDAVKLYRKILSHAKDASITILSIGYMTNLANLLASGADEYSSATGLELVRAKVDRMVVMAGEFPRGEEINILHEIHSARQALPSWPTPVIYIGYEVGINIRCGINLVNLTTNTSINPHSPVSKIFELALTELGHIDGCWDETAAYVLMQGVAPFFQLSAPGHIEIAENGTNYWIEDAQGKQAYVRQVASNEEIVAALNSLLER